MGTRACTLLVMVAAASAASAAPPGTRLGFDPTAWRIDGTRSLAFCPTELVAVEGDNVHRIDPATGVERSVVHVAGAADQRFVECRADGTALVIAARRATLVRADGTIAVAPIDNIVDARFSDDGVRMLTATALLTWDGSHAPVELHTVTRHDYAMLAAGGALLHGDDQHAILERTGKSPLALGDFVTELEGVTAAPDGTIAGLVDRRAHAIAFTFEGGAPHRVQLWEQIGARIDEVRISNHWVAVIAGGRDLIVRARPSLARTKLGPPCGGELALAIAITEDRLAVGCEHGLRMFALPSGELIGRTDAPRVALAWSPDGKLATLEPGGRIDTWDGLRHTTTIDAQAANFLWWRGADLVTPTIARHLVVWKHTKPTEEATSLAIDGGVANPTGDVALLAARWTKPKQRDVPLLAVDIRGAITELPIPDAAASILFALAISPDGKRGLALRIFEGRITVLTIDLVKRMVLPSDVAAEIIATSNTQAAIANNFDVTHLDGTKILTTISPVSQLAYSPDGRFLAVATRAGDLQIVGAARWPGDGSPINAIAWSPDGTRLAIATQTATYLWTP